MKTIKVNNHDKIKDGMKLYCISEKYIGDVWKQNDALYTDCCGWGDEPVCELNLDDIEIIEAD